MKSMSATDYVLDRLCDPISNPNDQKHLRGGMFGLVNLFLEFDIRTAFLDPRGEYRDVCDYIGHNVSQDRMKEGKGILDHG
jgi:hypothetical protein